MPAECVEKVKKIKRGNERQATNRGALGVWDYDHTVFGEVLAGDAESWAAIKELESLRTSRHGAAGAVNMIDGKVTLTLAWAHPLPKTKVVFAGSRDSRE